jgi:hypothetical protein
MKLEFNEQSIFNPQTQEWVQRWVIVTSQAAFESQHFIFYHSAGEEARHARDHFDLGEEAWNELLTKLRRIVGTKKIKPYPYLIATGLALECNIKQPVIFKYPSKCSYLGVMGVLIGTDIRTKNEVPYMVGDYPAELIMTSHRQDNKYGNQSTHEWKDFHGRNCQFAHFSALFSQQHNKARACQKTAEMIVKDFERIRVYSHWAAVHMECMEALKL